jgi:hypothetical protein
LKENKKEGGNLTIAWQYEKYLKKDSSSLTHHSGNLEGRRMSSFCNSYDLSKSCKQQYISSKKIQFVNINQLNEEDNYEQLFNKIQTHINLNHFNTYVSYMYTFNIHILML